MTPLQPRGEYPADRDDGAGAQPDHEPEDLVVVSTSEHLVPLQHVTKCQACLKTLYTVFVRSLEQYDQLHHADELAP